MIVIDHLDFSSDIGWLENLLLKEGDWLTAADILASVGKSTESQKRWLRALASESEWIISGQRGYKHLSHATEEEASHAANWLESQAEKMQLRARAILRNFKKPSPQ